MIFILFKSLVWEDATLKRNKLFTVNNLNCATIVHPPTYPTFEVLTITHYDDYGSLPSGLSSGLNTSATYTSNFYSGSACNVSPLYAIPLKQNSANTTMGVVTWRKIEVMGSGGTQYLSTVNIYDDYGREIQSQSINYTGGLDIQTTQFDFSGKELISGLHHQFLTAPAQTYESATLLTYDALQRPTMTQKMVIASVVSTPSWKTISTTAYNAIGQATTHTIGNNPNSTSSAYQPLESQTFEYNIRGWLLGVNRSYINNSNTTNPPNFFGYELGYDQAHTIVPGTTYAAQQYNSNVAGTVWKNGGDGEIRKYDFSYDPVDRLVGANFNQYSSSSFNKNDGLDFSVSGIQYDPNGNIMYLNRMGWKNGSSVPIDNLTYNYIANSNQLLNVEDGDNDPNTTLGDFHYSSTYVTQLGAAGKTTTTPDYVYDNNGNLIQDLNKNISSIVYNYLNLPTTINFGSKGSVSFIYDAAGNKLTKTTMESSGTISSVSTSITTTTTYVAGFVYQSVQYGATSLASSQYTNKLQFFGQDEGRVRALYGNTSSPNTLTGFVFDYYIRDHLGNTRMTLTEEQETDVYPTLTFEGAGSADVASQDATWDNSSGTAIGVMSVRQTPLPTGLTSGANGTYYASVVKGDQGGAIGAAKLIKVMARDQLNVSVNYNYNSATVDNSGANGLRTLVSSLAGMILGSSQVSAAVQSEASMVATNTGTSSAVTGFFSPEVPSSVTTGVAPEAYLHVLLFNDQFVFDNVNSMVMPISTAGLNASATLTVIATAAKNGYAYIYFSNESNTPVNFDNLALTDTRGPILETTDYYPFGLMMAGVSDVALKGGYSENKYRYNGKELQSQEFSDGSGLEEYDYGARLQDPQLGVWHNMDPLADKNRNWSPYNYAFDSPNGFVDPDGADAEQVGPDGLTNEQWAEASRPNANPTLASAYNAENLQQEFLQNRFQAAEKKFYETWDAATKETDPQKRTDGYIKAFLDIYDEFSDFASEAPKSEFFFKFGGKRGDATEFAQTDPEPVSPASSEAVEQPSHKNKVQIQVFDESIQEISNRTHTFGFIVRAFFHETVHVRQAQHHYDVYANQTSVYELDAYYISSTNQYLPPMSNGESIGNAGNAIRNFFIHMQDDTREAAYKLYQKKIDYFMGFFTKEAKDRIHEALKF